MTMSFQKMFDIILKELKSSQKRKINNNKNETRRRN